MLEDTNSLGGAHMLNDPYIIYCKLPKYSHTQTFVVTTLKLNYVALP